LSIPEFSLYVGVSLQLNGVSIVAIDGSSADPKRDPWKLVSFKRLGHSFDELVNSINDIPSSFAANSGQEKCFVRTKLFANDFSVSKGLLLRLSELNPSTWIEDDKEPSQKPNYALLLRHCKAAAFDGFILRTNSPDEMRQLESDLERVEFTPEGQFAVSNKNTSAGEALLLALGSRFAEWLETPADTSPWFCGT
jgi:hypothetical protein